MEQKNREKVDTALQLCKKNGKKSAQYLNEIKEDKHDFETGVREVLNEYYLMEKEQRGELGSFVDTLDESAKLILEHYEEAEQERENSENLNYETEEVVVAFPYGTSLEEIETIVGETALDYEIIDSGDTYIDEELPDYKKERLEKLKDFHSEVIILAKIGLEDTVKRAEEKFEANNCVVSASENSFLEAEGTIETSSGKVTLNDPKFNEDVQWHMKTIDVPRAWKKLKTMDGTSEIWVAVIDCGVQMNHPDLKGNLLTKYSVDVTQNNKKLIDCPDKKHKLGQYTGSHGTMVAGIIAAKSNNATMGAGVASFYDNEKDISACKIMAIKCDDSIEGRHITNAHLASAINYAVFHGAEVINISYSAPQKDYAATDFKAVQNAINKAMEVDSCVVAGVGNDYSTTLRYPAAFDNVIGVGATQPNNKMTTYSNQSAAVDIVALGGETDVKKIFSTAPTTLKTNGYAYGRGTSYATPQVAATVAMMRSINYNLEPKQMLTRLQSCSTVTVKGTIDKSKEFKLLNAGKAVALTKEP
ncbi:MAG: S8 family serine peptidase [Lachnospiraceae bacterium]|nr:S8 family serine peptidase [Lachnospiraceae bacterium]